MLDTHAAPSEELPASPCDEPPPSGVKRMMSVGLSASLEQFDDAALLSEGKVNLIALDVVVERFGARWPQRRDQVYDHVERVLRKDLGRSGYFIRVSDTDFLICQPELGRFSGQAACVRYLSDILTHFVGNATQADHCVHQVNVISANEIVAQKVDARHAEREEAAEQQAIEKVAIAKKEAAAKGPMVDQWSPFITTDGRGVRVSCTLEPVFELKTFGRIGFRMARRVMLVANDEELTPAALANLSRADILRIDLATIARGMSRLQADSGDERQPTLIIPVSFASLSNSAARAEIVSMLQQASSLVKQGIICEICDIEGVPQGAMLSATSLISPFSLFVVGRLSVMPVTPMTLEQLKGAGLRALSFECPRDQGQAEFLGWAKATIGAAKRLTKSVLVYRLASARDASLAAALGATHASLR
jgi:hypothetical protein